VRILFVQHPPERTGPSKSLVLLARSLVGEHELLAALRGEGELSTRLVTAGVRMAWLGPIDKWRLPRLVRLIRREKIDLVYANDTNSTARIVALAARVGGARFVCHVRSMGSGKGWRRMWYLRVADAVIAVSSACAESVRRFVGRGRLHVVYNGVPREELDPARAQDRGYLRDVLGLPANARVLIGVGHLCERKGQKHAVQALGLLSSRCPEAHLCLVGSHDREPAYVEEIRRAAREAGLESRLHLTGFRTDVARLLAGTDVFLHTALTDPHPRAVIEAMAAGRPVVAFDVDGVSETVVTGDTGLLVEPGDSAALATSLVEVLEAPQRAAAMGEAGRERVRRSFTEDATAAAVGRILGGLSGVDGMSGGERSDALGA
jgi:glycosyltransferase involved in cell wall biosynthesis